MNMEEADQIDNSRLNLRKLSHRTKFIEKLEEMIEISNLDQIMSEQCYLHASNKMLLQVRHPSWAHLRFLRSCLTRSHIDWF